MDAFALSRLKTLLIVENPRHELFAPDRPEILKKLRCRGDQFGVHLHWLAERRARVAGQHFAAPQCDRFLWMTSARDLRLAFHHDELVAGIAFLDAVILGHQGRPGDGCGDGRGRNLCAPGIFRHS